MAAMALQDRQRGGDAVTRCSRRAAGARLGLGRILALFVTIAFLFGIVVGGPAEHAAFEGEPSSAVHVLASNPSSPASLKAPGDHKAPVNKALDACTGHCAAHGTSLPASFALEAVTIAERAPWQPEQDHRLVAGRPMLLDRPPRA